MYDNQEITVKIDNKNSISGNIYYTRVSDTVIMYHYVIVSHINYYYNTLTFQATVANYDFLQALVDFVEPILKQKSYNTNLKNDNNIRKINAYANNNMARNFCNNAVITKLIEGKESFTTEDIIKILILTDEVYLKDKNNVNVDVLVEIYKKRINNGLSKDEDSFIQADYFRPYLSDLTVNEILYSMQYNFENKAELIDNTFWSAVYTDDKVDANMLVKDYVIHDDYVFNAPKNLRSDVPLKNKGFYNYALNLTVEDFRFVYNHLSPSMSAKAAIKVSDEIIKRKNSVTIGTSIVDDALTKILDMDRSWNDAFYSLRACLRDKNTDPIIVKIVCDHILNNNISKTRLESIVKVFVNSKSSWISPSNQAVYVLYKLSDVLDSDSIVELLVEISDSKHSFTVSKWDKIIKNINEYKGMPVSWWVELI